MTANNPAANTSTFSEEPLSQLELPPGRAEGPALVVLWSRDEPGRMGEVLLIPAQPPELAWIFGRGEQVSEKGQLRLKLVRQRPGRLDAAGALRCPRISRAQLKIRARGTEGLTIGNIGRCPLLVNGRQVDQAEVNFGDVLELQNELLLLCVCRPGLIPSVPEDVALPAHPFGESDGFGLVGESAVLWELRRQVALVAVQGAHVLILGPSGTGKELVAKAIHARSSRKSRQIISRNAATFPEGLIDAELFGNMKHYPNPGMPERPGLVGEADGSSLFLDEFAELPIALQAHLLRVMDEGEYQRLGEATLRRSSFRLIAATNRPERYLKEDIRARLKTRIKLRGLNDRREDIPLLVRHLLRRHAANDPSIAQRFFLEASPRGEPRITPTLMYALVRHHYRTHIRELEGLLLRAVMDSPGRYVDLTPEVREELESVVEAAPAFPPSGAPAGPVDELSAPQVSAASAPASPPTSSLAAPPGSSPASSLASAPASSLASAPASPPTSSLASPPGSSPDSSLASAPDSSLASAPASSLASPPAPTPLAGPLRWIDPRHCLVEFPAEELTYERLHELCEDLKATYIERVLLDSEGKLFRAAKRLQCNRDVIRRYMDRAKAG